MLRVELKIDEGLCDSTYLEVIFIIQTENPLKSTISTILSG